MASIVTRGNSPARACEGGSSVPGGQLTRARPVRWRTDRTERARALYEGEAKAKRDAFLHRGRFDHGDLVSLHPLDCWSRDGKKLHVDLGFFRGRQLLAFRRRRCGAEEFSICIERAGGHLHMTK